MSNLSAGYIIQDKDGNAIYGFGPSSTRAMDRARTYEGLAAAMAEQWSLT